MPEVGLVETEGKQGDMLVLFFAMNIFKINLTLRTCSSSNSSTFWGLLSFGFSLSLMKGLLNVRKLVLPGYITRSQHYTGFCTD